VLAVIPYETFPTIELGPLTLRTFGLFVALGVLVGAWLAARYVERFGIDRDETYRVATWMVLAGIIGSRLTWAATHTDAIDNPIDVIAIWEGGIQFSGGFIAALIVGLPFFRRWTRLQRWRVLDGYALGLAIGLALGRVGCYSVGEHFGRTSDFFLATRFDGGEVREPTLGDVPLVVGTTFHNTALYELLYLLVLFAGLSFMVWRARRRDRELAPGTLVGTFVLFYGVARLASDALRVNDERVASLTGAQWMCAVMIPAGAWILWKVRPSLAKLAAAAPAEDAEKTSDDESKADASKADVSEDAEPSDDESTEPVAESTDDAETPEADAEPESSDDDGEEPAAAGAEEPSEDAPTEPVAESSDDGEDSTPGADDGEPEPVAAADADGGKTP
jgi:phosphatidylglycerol:prolipoprotein diacylglycerol transferase